ncbi:MAG TPA: hypothetical protein VL295_04300 [Gemmatimonadales bacterium]|nr:hypothetical protein [Gemmatimonadales bacterium]
MRASSVVRGAWGIALAAITCAAAPLRLSAQERAIPLDPAGYLRVINRVGSVRVIGWDVDSVRWGAPLAPGAELFGGGSARMVKVGVEGPDAPTALVVRAPRRAKLVIDAGESTVEVEGMTGPVEIQGGSGAVNFTGAPVRLTIETVDGAVTLAGGPYRSTQVRTAGGMIRVAGARGELVLSSVTGAVIAEADSITRGSVTTVAGVIRLAGSVDPTGTLTVESHGGDIQLRLDPRQGYEVVATAFGGSIENGLTSTAPRPVRDGRGHQLETTVGGGGGTVTVTSFKGRVRIERR